MQNAELEAGLLKRTQELEAANRELEAFSFSVSHDLRAPLRHIRGYMDVLLEDPESKFSDSGQRCASSITRAAGQMNQLIEDLLMFSKMSRVEMEKSRFKMTELVQETIGDMAAEVQDRDIQWRIQPLPDLTADRSMLKQVWVNLLSNAVKYTRTRAPAEISVGAIRKDGEWEFSVCDNGVGFDMKNAGKLFGVFQRLHEAKDFEGTGIGLANVRRTISRHGGRTWAEASPGEGACFYFTLPAQSDEPKA
jgi:light-regulated signal transduction histidine kinase (bacteriophytochrome)